MFRGHKNVVYGGLRNFPYKNGLYKNVCNVIRFRENEKYRKDVHGDDIQDALSGRLAFAHFLQLAMISFAHNLRFQLRTIFAPHIEDFEVVMHTVLKHAQCTFKNELLLAVTHFN